LDPVAKWSLSSEAILGIVAGVCVFVIGASSTLFTSIGLLVSLKVDIAYERVFV
jgi:hypothetical protein